MKVVNRVLHRSLTEGRAEHRENSGPQLSANGDRCDARSHYRRVHLPRPVAAARQGRQGRPAPGPPRGAPRAPCWVGQKPERVARSVWTLRPKTLLVQERVANAGIGTMPHQDGLVRNVCWVVPHPERDTAARVDSSPPKVCRGWEALSRLRFALPCRRAPLGRRGSCCGRWWRCGCVGFVLKTSLSLHMISCV